MEETKEIQESKLYTDPRLVMDTINLVLNQSGLRRLQQDGANSPEWFGQCPRCLALNGYAGKDRLSVTPGRPAYAGGATGVKPVFYCRQCTITNKKGLMRPWTGDLIQFLRDTCDMTFFEAWNHLGIPQEYLGKGMKILGPNHDVGLTVPPSVAWREQGSALVEQCIEILWSDVGAPVRKYLQARGITEETMRWARLGYTGHLTRYIDDESWGLEGSIKIPNGIVFPEFHIDLTTGEEILWSVVIRRPDRDIQRDLLETGERSEKYHAIRGSTKGLYLFDSCLEQNDTKKPCVLVEGHMDALTIVQESQHQWGAAGLQSVTGARRNYWKMRLLDIPMLVLIATDDDPEGRKAAQYWIGELDASAYYWPPKSHDPNEMLIKQMDIPEWLQTGGARCTKLYLLKRQEIATGKPLEPTKQESGVIVSPEPEAPQIVKLKPIPFISASNERNNVEIERTESGYVCERCGEEAMYHNKSGYHWCRADFASYQLIELQEQRGWHAFEFPAGNGLVRAAQVNLAGFIEKHGGEGRDVMNAWDHPENPFSGNASDAFESADGGRVPPGESGAIKFCQEFDRVQIWLAAREAYGILHKLIDPNKKIVTINAPVMVQYRCANMLCGYDRKRPYYPQGEPYRNSFGQMVWPSGKMGDFYEGVSTWGTLHWCPRCTDCHRLLRLAEVRGFPACHLVVTAPVEDGKDNWIDFATGKNAHDKKQHLFDVSYVFDEMFRYCKSEGIMSTDVLEDIFYVYSEGGQDAAVS